SSNTIQPFSSALTPSYLVPPCAETPMTYTSNQTEPCCFGKILISLGSGINATSAVYPLWMAASVPAPPVSSSITLSYMTSPFNSMPNEISVSNAINVETFPPFISVAPLPYNFPSTTVPEYGWCFHFDSSPEGTTSIWPFKIRERPSLLAPLSTPTTFGLFS